MQSAGFVTRKQRSPIGIGGAVAVHVVVVAVYLLTPKEVIEQLPPVITLGRNIPVERKLDPVPPPPERIRTEEKPVLIMPKPELGRPADGPAIATAPDSGETLPTFSTLDGAGTGAVETKIPDPVLIDARPDPRFLEDFQPGYPTNLQRLELEGRVTVRVKIGADGRVRAVQLVSATHEDFFKVTERQALRRWRFKPATRDGVAIESWREMTVHFRLED